MKLVQKLGIVTASAVIGITSVGASSAAQAVQLYMDIKRSLDIEPKGLPSFPTFSHFFNSLNSGQI
ncbi:hypothetical protein [Nostoc sp.]|uniref:hypothetical protein n=1 Tax=Nostoc sp. TaxID=1180 RepID=UPI002FFC7590